MSPNFPQSHVIKSMKKGTDRKYPTIKMNTKMSASIRNHSMSGDDPLILRKRISSKIGTLSGESSTNNVRSISIMRKLTNSLTIVKADYYGI
jgi:hypothetical protein